ncbi:hypothetical protein V8B97DRAFT_2084198, partial [Scleroderma yunnanense]
PPEVLELSQMISQTTSAIFNQFTNLVGSQEENRKKLIEELIALNGVTNTIKAFITDEDWQGNQDEYHERLRKLEPLWFQGGVIIQAIQLVGRILSVLASSESSSADAGKQAFPLSQEDMAEYILQVAKCRRAITDTLYSDPDECSYSPDDTSISVQKALKLYEWLDTVDITEMQGILTRLREKDTCNWLFDKTTCKTYAEWSTADSRTLWLCGQAGTGKSVIAAAIVDHLTMLERDPAEQSVAEDVKIEDRNAEIPVQDSVAYYFCDFHDLRSLRTRTILLSIFVQFTQTVEEKVLDMFPDLVDRQALGLSPQEDLDVLQDLLARATRLHEKKVIIIDGINECEDALAVLACLDKIVASEKDVRLLITSRPDQIFLDRFDGGPAIKLEDYIECTNTDMRKMLAGRIDRHRRLSAIPQATKKNIIDTIVDKAQGSFWYARCQVDSLRECRSLRSVHNIIRNFPADLPSTYDAILEQVESMSEDVRLILQRTLRWLGGALRPMTIAQGMECPMVDVTKPYLDDNISVVSDDDFFLVCGALVVYDEPTKRVSLGSRTVLDYLTGTPTKEKFARYFFDAQKVHKELALSCITYVLTEDIGKAVADAQKPAYLFESTRYHSLLDRRPLLLYALEGGFEYMRRIATEDDDVIDLMQRLQDQVKENPETYRMVVDSLNDHQGGNLYRWIVEERELVLGIVLRFGPSWMVKRFLLRRRDLLEGETGSKLPDRVTELRRSSELTEMVRDMV